MTTNGSVLNSVTEFMKEFSGVLFPPHYKFLLTLQSKGLQVL